MTYRPDLPPSPTRLKAMADRSRVDMTGMTLGSLTVIGRGAGLSTGAYWKCRCVCGNEAVRQGTSLRQQVKRGMHPCCDACARVRTAERNAKRASAR